MGNKIPVRYVRNYSGSNTVNSSGIWTEIQVIRNGENIALGIVPTPSAPLTWGVEVITDGSTDDTFYTFDSWGLTYIDIDLGQIYDDLESVKVWHYYSDGRTFTGKRTLVSTDGVNWIELYNSAVTGNVPETPEGQTIPIPAIPSVRYIRDSIQGTNGNHWIEVEAYSNGTNVALGKPVTHAGSAYSGSPANVTDGDFSVLFETGNAPLSWVQIDLGVEIKLNEIKVWHYFQDGRIYDGAKTEVSADGENWVTVFDSAISGTYAESAEGHSISLLGVETPVSVTETPFLINLGTLEVNKIFLGDKQVTNLYLGAESLLDIPEKPVVAVTSLTNSVRLDWPVTRNTTSWNVYRSEVAGTLGAKVTGGSFIKVNTFTDDTVIGGTTYYYTIESKNAVSNKATKGDQLQAFPYAIQVYENKIVDFIGYAGWTVYGPTEVDSDFGNHFTLQGDDRLKIDTAERLRFYLPAGVVGSANTGGIIKANIAGKNEYTMEYEIRFDSGFPWSKGGKVPGLSGGVGYTGGEPATAGDGFSVRLMWREDGRIIPYVYHYKQKDQFGDTFGATLGYFTHTKAHKVKYYVKLNTVGENDDGILQVYLDDVLVFEKTDMCYRTNQCQIDTCHIAIFAGGSTADWNMTADGYIRLSYIQWQ